MGLNIGWADVLERKGLIESPTELRDRYVPIPPSVNNLFATFRGRRIKSTKYRQWIAAAFGYVGGWTWGGKYPVAVRLTIREKVNEQRDGDNFCKPVLDLLVAAKVIRGDSLKHVRGVEVRYLPGTGQGVGIEIRET